MRNILRKENLVAENENRLAIISIPLKLAASLIFDGKIRAKVFVVSFYRGKLIDFAKCELVDFLYDWNSENLDFKFRSAEFEEILDGEKIPKFWAEFREFENPFGLSFSGFSFGGISTEPSLKKANSEMENLPYENYAPSSEIQNSAAENIREQKLHTEIERAIENVLESNYSGITENDKFLIISNAKNCADILRKRKKGGKSYRDWLEYVRMNFHPEIAIAIINYAENSSKKELAAVEISPQQIKIENGLTDTFLQKYSKSENPEIASDEPEFLPR